jgi:hypothetical protein
MRDIAPCTGEEVIKTDHFMIFAQEALAKVTPHEPSASSN